MRHRREVDVRALQATLLAASLPVLAAEARRRRDPGLVPILLAAQLARFAAAHVHHDVLERVYRGSNDTDEYHAAGAVIAEHLASGRLRDAATAMRTVPWDTRVHGPFTTNLMRLLSGLVYLGTGPSRRASFVVFSWAGFWGMVLFERAFATAVPGGDARAYRRLLLASPSLAYWTSVTSKESWTLLSLGVAAEGMARGATGSPRTGAPLALLGLTGAAAVRAQRGGRFGLTVGSGLRDAGERSFLGASRFTPPRADSPRDVPLVIASVLFRPHPLEAHNLQARAAAAESAALVVLSLARAGWIAAALASAPRRPYVALATASLGGLVAYLSRVSNLGMLVRQRTPALPFYLVLLSVPPRRRRR